MATTGTAQLQIGLLGERKIEKVFQPTLTGGAVTFVITLDSTFTNTPKMLAVPPLGADGTYTPSYNAATPSITVTVSGETNLGATATFDMIVVAYDQP